MSDPVAFLAARLDEDEAMARAAIDVSPAPWHAEGRWLIDAADQSPAISEDFEDAPIAHMARHDPARVLREVAAKRAILAELDRFGTSQAPGAVRVRLLHDFALRQFLAAYSDHPDYDQEWKP